MLYKRGVKLLKIVKDRDMISHEFFVPMDDLARVLCSFLMEAQVQLQKDRDNREERRQREKMEEKERKARFKSEQLEMEALFKCEQLQVEARLKREEADRLAIEREKEISFQRELLAIMAKAIHTTRSTNSALKEHQEAHTSTSTSVLNAQIAHNEHPLTRQGEIIPLASSTRPHVQARVGKLKGV